MASQAQPAPAQPTTFYFAYGSNLHLKQMKRRCPNSKYIGKARLENYRWQINERGYANVVSADGHWVDGLVYEINPTDEAKLDINEGVSKNAYTKKQLQVLLHRAPSTLYRRPVTWIVNRGGPEKIVRVAKESGTKTAQHERHWRQEVLVYISLNYVQDSDPKEEYINRINLGIFDARALGIDDDYISNCIRPLIPAPPGNENTTEKPALKSALRGQKRNASPRTGERSPARRGQTPERPNKQTTQPTPARTVNNNGPKRTRRAMSSPAPPPLPPRPQARYRDAPIIVVEEFHYSSRSV